MHDIVIITEKTQNSRHWRHWVNLPAWRNTIVMYIWPFDVIDRQTVKLTIVMMWLQFKISRLT